jgi:O6-methylguanine-DNA--protein-cysteine methyltransferase
MNATACACDSNRVVGGSEESTGYRWGVEWKPQLLDAESAKD